MNVLKASSFLFNRGITNQNGKDLTIQFNDGTPDISVSELLELYYDYRILEDKREEQYKKENTLGGSTPKNNS